MNIPDLLNQLNNLIGSGAVTLLILLAISYGLWVFKKREDLLNQRIEILENEKNTNLYSSLSSRIEALDKEVGRLRADVDEREERIKKMSRETKSLFELVTVWADMAEKEGWANAASLDFLKQLLGKPKE